MARHLLSSQLHPSWNGQPAPWKDLHISGRTFSCQWETPTLTWAGRWQHSFSQYQTSITQEPRGQLQGLLGPLQVLEASYPGPLKPRFRLSPLQFVHERSSYHLSSEFRGSESHTGRGLRLDHPIFWKSNYVTADLQFWPSTGLAMSRYRASQRWAWRAQWWAHAYAVRVIWGRCRLMVSQGGEYRPWVA